MLKSRLAAAHAVRDAFVPLKRATIDLSTQAGRCCATLAEQRTKAGLDKNGFGAKPMGLVAKAAALIAEAEGCLAQAHVDLGEMITAAGLSQHFEYGFGPDQTADPRTAETARVRLAA